MIRLGCDLPKQDESVVFGTLQIIGWAVYSAPLHALSVFIDDTLVTDGHCHDERPDVATAFPENACTGFSFLANLSAMQLSPGPHFCVVKADAEDGTSAFLQRRFLYLPTQALVQDLEALKSSLRKETLQNPALLSEQWAAFLERQFSTQSYQQHFVSSSLLERMACFYQNGVFRFRDVYLPDVSNDPKTFANFPFVYQDSLMVYTEYNDNYHYQLVDKLDPFLPEGVYCYQGPNGEDITVHPGDVVIDAGAWIGDFSAYAAVKGAQVFAFEPSPMNRIWLEQTKQLNEGKGNIEIIPMGLGAEPTTTYFDESPATEQNNSGGNCISETGSEMVELTSIDCFARQNGLHINFIKADIEGFERFMLQGAVETLKNDHPVLSICTYHLPDDQEVLSRIILEAEPCYKIIFRKKKLFAYVPSPYPILPPTFCFPTESDEKQRLQAMEEVQQWLRNRVANFEEGQAWLSDKVHSYEEGQAWLTDKVHSYEEGQARLSDKVRSYEEGQARLSDKVRSFEEGQAWLSDKVHSYEEGQVWLSDKIRAFEEGQTWLDDKMREVDSLKDWFAGELLQVKNALSALNAWQDALRQTNEAAAETIADMQKTEVALKEEVAFLREQVAKLQTDCKQLYEYTKLKNILKRFFLLPFSFLRRLFSR